MCSLGRRAHCKLLEWGLLLVALHLGCSTHPMNTPAPFIPSALSYRLSVTSLGLGNVVVFKGGAPAGTLQFDPGTEIALVAQGAEGWVFDVWDGDAVGNEKTIVVVMDSNKNIKANFSVLPGPRIGPWVATGFENWSANYPGYFAFEVHHDGQSFLLTDVHYEFDIICDGCPDRPGHPQFCLTHRTAAGSGPCQSLSINNGTIECAGGKLTKLRIEFKSSNGGPELDVAIVDADVSENQLGCDGYNDFPALVDDIALPVQ